MDHNIRDQATAKAVLNSLRDTLALCDESSALCNKNLRDAIVSIRPAGLLTVAEMADAVGHNRSYIDAVWSVSKGTVKGKQTRVPVGDVAGDKSRWAFESLVDLAAQKKRATDNASTARAERDRAVAMVYASKLLGPSAIAAEAGIDRNHVLRIARKAGVEPMHRAGSKNQYTA